mgnify:CR=1 FL=1
MEDIKTVGVGVSGILIQFIEIMSPVLTFIIGIATLVYIIQKTRLTILNYKNAKQKKTDL